MPATYPPGYDPNQGLEHIPSTWKGPLYDYDAVSPGDRDLMGIMTLVSMTAFMMAGGYVNAIPAATCVEADVANLVSSELSAEVRADLIATLKAEPLAAGEAHQIFAEAIGGPLTVEEKAIAQAGMLADLTTTEGKIAYAAAEQYIAKQNFLNVIRMAENDTLASSRYLSDVAAYHVLYGDRPTHGTIGNYIHVHGPGAVDGGSPGFPGFPGVGFPNYHDTPLNNGPGGHGTWACIMYEVGGGELVRICYWEP
jgi:hypothetical protein